MPDAKTLQAYINLVTAYLTAADDLYLTTADALGRELLERGIDLEELAALNQAALEHLLRTHQEINPATVVASCSDMLRRLLAVYDTDGQERRRELEAVGNELRERETFLRGVIDAAPAAINIKDRDGRYVLVNRYLAAMFGVSPEDMVGRTDEQKRRMQYKDLNGTDDDSQVLKSGMAVLNREGEYRINGERSVWFSSKTPIKDDSGNVSHVATVSIDITERILAEEELRKSEQQFRRIVESHPLPVWLVEIDSGRILYESPAAAELLGVEWPANEQRNVVNFYAEPGDRRAYLAEIKRTGEVRDLKFQVKRADGNVIWVSVTSRLLQTNGPPVAISSMVDLTERLAFEDELERQKEILHQNEKLSAMGELLASVAHELNNPLSVVVGQAILLAESAADEQMKDRAERIGNAAERCGRIVKTFLAMARQQPSISEPIDVNQAIDVALEVCSDDLNNADIAISRHLSHKLPAVAADFGQISQVIANLIINAKHAMENHSDDRVLKLTSSFRPTTGDVVVKVKDSGPGIPSEIRNRIFEPFFTTKATGKGTGIGLALCHRIIETHGGRIKLDDACQDGTAFVIKLPCHHAERAEQLTMETTTQGARQLSILAIDDEEDMTELVADILRFDGHDVETANSGKRALELIARNDFDVILSDLRMPGLDGPTLFRHLEESRPELVSCIAFITGDTLSTDIHQFLKTSKRPYLEKPAGPADIRALVQAIAEQRDT